MRQTIFILLVILFAFRVQAQEELLVDCEGVLGGTAFYDECLQCVGGNTGLSPCVGGCQTGNPLPSEMVQNVCDGQAFVLTPVNASLPAGASWGMFIYPVNGETTFGLGALDQPLLITGITQFPLVFNSDLNGILSFNGWPPLIGTWAISAVIYFETLDGNGFVTRDFCGRSDDIFVTFGLCDCAGVAEGGAFFDACGACVGGTTGLVACNPNCFSPVVQAPGLNLNFAFTSATEDGWGAIVGVYPNVTANAVRYIDEVGGGSLACDAASNTNDLAGKVVLIDRGNCNFSLKALNAQQAGAAAVVVVNNIPGSELQVMGIGDFGAQVTIPTVLISYDDGQLLYNAMLGGDVPLFIGNACDPTQLGCTVPAAINYNPSATIDDGSCLVEVVFSVDMSNEIVNPSGVHIAANFQGFDPSITPMTNEGNGIWSYSDIFLYGTLLEYVFVNGTDFAGVETVSTVCSSNGVRTWSALGVPLPTVCFASCGACQDLGVCSVGTDVLPSEITVCDGESFTLDPTDAVVPVGGAFGVFITPINVISGPNFNFYLQSVNVPFELDNDLSGILSSNGFDPLQGTYSIYAFVYANPADVLGSICSTTETVIFTFGPCAPEEVPGCTYATACNYNAAATLDNGTCDFVSCSGCTSPMACNFDATATLDDGSCDYLSCAGCTYIGASNYNAAATVDNGSCVFDTEATCGADLNGDGTVNTTDLLGFLTAFGNACE